MELTIQNFKGIKSKKISFTNNFYLFKGNSGSGKSTVCEAIKYVLYNTTRNIKPLYQFDKTLVNLKYQDLDLTRSKNPELLTCIKNDKKYINNEAQEIINQKFNISSIWSMSSYIAQNKRNIFLESTNNERFEILKKIIFKEDLIQSEKFLNFLDKLIFKLIENVKKYDNLIYYLDEKITTFDNENPHLESLYKKALEYKNLEKLIIEYKNKLKDYYLYNDYLKHNIDSLDSLKNNLEKNYPKDLDLDLINDWREYLSIKKDIDNFLFLKNISSLENLYSEYHDCLNNQKIKEKIKSENITKLRKNILKKIDFLNNKKTEKKLQKLKEYLTSLESTFLKLNSNWDSFLKSFYHEVLPYSKQLSDAILKNYLSEKIQNFTCPSCKKCLYLKKGNLVEKAFFLSEKDKTNFRKLVAKLEEITKLKNTTIFKISELEKNYIANLEDIEINIEDSNLENTLEIIKDYKKDIRDIEDIKRDINYIKLEKKYIRLKNFINFKYPVPEDFDNYYKKYNLDKNLFKKFKDLNIKDIKDFDPSIIENLEKLKNAKDKYLTIDKEKNKLLEYKNKRLEYVNLLENSKKLKDIYNETIYSYLEKNIENINNKLNSILISLFDNLNININLFKEVKSKKDTEKPMVNFSIIMDGKEYPNFNYFSGGEKDRISIALTLTFNIILGSKILIFDEVFSSLEESKRIECLKAIKNYSPHKILINICHETVEGYYDKIIDF